MRSLTLRLALLGAVFWYSASVAATESSEPLRELPDRVRRILEAYDMPASSFSAYVHRLGENKPLLAVNQDQARNPASTIKLLTTFLALEELGPTYRWKTEAYLGGDLRDGVLAGDLYIKGYGDPYLVTERLWLFQRDLRQRGLTRISGDLVIDNTYFELETVDPGAFDGQNLRTYNVVPDALLVNFQAINFVFRPDPLTNTVDIVADPMPVNLDIQNQIRLANGRCGGYQNGISLAVTNGSGPDRVTFSGRYGRDCPEYRLSRAVMQGPDYAYGVFRGLWEEGGGIIDGSLRTEPVPEELKIFARAYSPSLSEIIRAVNKWSNNVMTRHILLTLGAEAFGPPATVAKGREAAGMFLGRRGLDFAELQLDNGSGLSRDTRITARSMGRLLLAAQESLYRAEFVSSMALAGLDGTMGRRFRNDDLTGRMHIKTGRLDGVFAMAGYIVSKTDREYVFVAIQNHPDAHRGPGEEAQSALLRWVYRQ